MPWMAQLAQGALTATDGRSRAIILIVKGAKALFALPSRGGPPRDDLRNCKHFVNFFAPKVHNLFTNKFAQKY
jgi:hypothetical protein